jgi:hypothetical protein
MGAVGWARVLGVGPCPELEAGPGRLVTGWFRHRRGAVWDLVVEGEPGPIGVTAGHPFWSEDRGGWVAAGELGAGERLRAWVGSTPAVVSLALRPGHEPVYNIEVDGDHCYRVGRQGLLVHNNSLPGTAVADGTNFQCGRLSGSGSIVRDKPVALNTNIGSPPACVSNAALTPPTLPCKYEGHHLIGVEQAENSAIMRRAKLLGYDINRKNNGAYYPSYGTNYGVTKAQAQQYALNYAMLPLHKGPHDGPLVLYTSCIEKHLQKLEADYRAGAVNDCNLCAEITKIENKLRMALLVRDIWLHRNDLHPKVVAGNPVCNL